ncbi:uncharacterized protein HMPREF1541_10322 [Cyphellophora europaea CBS 101466]|uniref:Uncharacterized protein n=1 Tax=Cyphellophora europaea (strain CBS 101466) TaxID=1220924 RepID=W2S7I8_CYPE1|nr:uncharacterized protein HMPREF1541_10322 [Cyphellophora europaea CBS 101466]ETN44652.1 hypothetical protein HMPREF1541_10322 [Cyphellophora europaea CBS 101466]
MHRDLRALELTDKTVPQVTALIEYVCRHFRIPSSVTTASSTAAAVNDDNIHTINETVLAYTLWKAKDLVEYDAFLELLKGSGEFVKEFTVERARRDT